MIKKIPIDKIVIENNCRKNITQKSIYSLYKSILKYGLKQPVGVIKKGEEYVLIYGHRRLAACKDLEWKEIEARIDSEMDGENMIIINLLENLQREDPSLYEYGKIIDKLIQLGLSQEEISEKICISNRKLQDIMKVYGGLPRSAVKMVDFIHKKDADRKTGFVSKATANKIIDIKRKHDLDDKTVKKVFDHCLKQKTTEEDIENISLIIKRGQNVGKAINDLAGFESYHLTIVASKAEIKKIKNECGIPSTSLIFQKIIYGESPPIEKPYFIETGKREKKIKHDLQSKRNQEIKKIDLMRCEIGCQDRLGNLTEQQHQAYIKLIKTTTRLLSEGQIIQMNNIYKDIMKKN